MIPTPLAALLAPLSRAYAGGVWLRQRLYRTGWLACRRLRVPVVCVGNLVVGGTGKTPAVVWLARRLQARNLGVAVVSRGYGRRSRGVQVVADRQAIRAGVAAGGDEPVWIARACPGVAVVVGEDRAAAGRHAEAAFGPDIVLLDDGFQHLRLERDLDLLVLDATTDHSRLRLLPAGPLREPLGGIARAGAVLVTRAHRETDPEILTALVRRHNPRAPVVRLRPWFRALRSIDGSAEPIGWLAGARVVAMSGIGNPGQFEADLRDLGAEVVARLRFRDHRPYGRREIEAIGETLRRSGAAAVVTTAKDLIRLEALAPRTLALAALEMDLVADDGLAPLEAALDRLVPAGALAGAGI